MEFSDGDQDIVAHIRAAVPDVLAIYQFGSAGTDGMHSESDLDVVILPPEPISSEAHWNLEQNLSIALHRDVDLRTASTVMRMQGGEHGAADL